MRARTAVATAFAALWLSACQGESGVQPAPPEVTVTETVPQAATPTSTASTDSKPRLTKVQRQIAASQKLNKRHPNDGRYTYILDEEGGRYGLVAVKVAPCQGVAGMKNGCFMSAFVNIKSLVDGLLVNPADFYILAPDNRRHSQGGGDSLFVTVNGERLELSSLNANEVLTGVITFDAPAHGRLIYDPPFADARVTWIF